METDDGELADRLRGDPVYRQWQFSTELPVAVAKGDFAEVKVLVNQFAKCQVPGLAVKEGARHGRLEILMWLHHHGYALSVVDGDVEIALGENHPELALWLRDIQLTDGLEPSMNRFVNWACAALTHGNLHMVQWCRKETKRHKSWIVDMDSGTRVLDPSPRALSCPRALKMAAEGGQALTLEWLLNNDCCSKVKLEDAVMGGHFMLIKWLYCHYKDQCIVGDALLAAARLGNLPIARWLMETVDDVDNCVWESMDQAAGNGHLDFVQWLHSVAPESCTARAMDLAATGGHLDVVKWIHYYTIVGCTTAAMDGAAGGGHLPVVQWLHLHRHEGCTTAAMDLAAGNNHLDVVQWLHSFRSEGCTTKAMDCAASGGHFEMVKWLHENVLEGCTSEAMDGAASAGHLDIVQWLHFNCRGGCTTKAMDEAAANGHLHVAKWLHLNCSEGCTPQAMDGAARGGHLDVVQWLHCHRTEGCTTQAMDEAAANGHFHIVLFLQRERTEGCTAAAFSTMRINRHDESLQWLRDHYPAQHDEQFQMSPRRSWHEHSDEISDTVSDLDEL